MAHEWTYAIYKGLSILISPLELFIARRRQILFQKRNTTNDTTRVAEFSLSHIPRSFQTKSIVWFHAASLGESLSAIPLVNQVLQSNNKQRVLFTVSSSSAPIVLQKRLNNERVIVQFAPFDFYFSVIRFLNLWNPTYAIFIESELWPNLICASKSKGIPLFLVNAHLSKNTVKSWNQPLLHYLLTHILHQFSMIFCKSTQDVETILPFIKSLNGQTNDSVSKQHCIHDHHSYHVFESTAKELMASETCSLQQIRQADPNERKNYIQRKRISQRVCHGTNQQNTNSNHHDNNSMYPVVLHLGDLKQDDFQSIEVFGQHTLGEMNTRLTKPNRFIWMAVSTHDGENETIIKVHALLQHIKGMENAITIIAPRHPEKCIAIMNMIESLKIPYVRHSTFPKGERLADGSIYLIDVLGELNSFYPIVPNVFVGASLKESLHKGQHNINEALRYGCHVFQGSYATGLKTNQVRYIDGEDDIANHLKARVLHGHSKRQCVPGSSTSISTWKHIQDYLEQM